MRKFQPYRLYSKFLTLRPDSLKIVNIGEDDFQTVNISRLDEEPSPKANTDDKKVRIASIKITMT